MPEPTSMILLGGGIIGMLFRFTKACFEQLKRMLDVILSMTILIIFTPLFLLFAMCIKISSSGPVIFSQVRVGKDDKVFTMYKLRTMDAKAEKDTGPIWSRYDDPRAFPVGTFLRKTHLDEMPQFFNVIKGDMSIIGPRPERPHFVDNFKKALPDYQKRLAVRPGITGLAQISHKADSSMDDVRKKLGYDLEYISRVKKKSWFNELRIMFNTLVIVMTGKEI